MKLLRAAICYASDGLSSQLRRPLMARMLSTDTASGPGNNVTRNGASSESSDDFERRIFGGHFEDRSDPFFLRLDKLEKAHDRFSLDSEFNRRSEFDAFGDLDGSFNTLSDEMEDKLEEAAKYFKFDADEADEEDYSFRPDMNFELGSTYETKDLDLTKPGVWKPYKPKEFHVTSEEVMRKADFRNVRFLANFLTQSGMIIKRSTTKISAKAQRKVAREIKTARAFGLLPFTTMGTKSFVFGKTMEDLDKDYEYENYDSHTAIAGVVPE